MAKHIYIFIAVSLLFSLLSVPMVMTEQLVDPMRPSGYDVPRPQPQVKEAETDTSSWRLTAVLTAADRRVAVVNGLRLQQGESLDGFTVKKILPDRVYLQKGKRNVVLQRAGTGLKKETR